MNSPINPLLSSIIIITLGLSISGCSKNFVNASGQKSSSTKSYLHTHLPNKCIGAIQHAHANGNKKHHHFFHECKKISATAKSNAHFHRSSSSITGYIRHVHPNGANQHTHAGLKS